MWRILYWSQKKTNHKFMIFIVFLLNFHGHRGFLHSIDWFSREHLQENPIVHLNIYGFRFRFSLCRQPIGVSDMFRAWLQTSSPWLPVGLESRQDRSWWFLMSSRWQYPNISLTHNEWWFMIHDVLINEKMTPVHTEAFHSSIFMTSRRDVCGRMGISI